MLTQIEQYWGLFIYISIIGFGVVISMIAVVDYLKRMRNTITSILQNVSLHRHDDQGNWEKLFEEMEANGLSFEELTQELFNVRGKIFETFNGVVILKQSNKDLAQQLFVMQKEFENLKEIISADNKEVSARLVDELHIFFEAFQTTIDDYRNFQEQQAGQEIPKENRSMEDLEISPTMNAPVEEYIAKDSTTTKPNPFAKKEAQDKVLRDPPKKSTGIDLAAAGMEKTVSKEWSPSSTRELSDEEKQAFLQLANQLNLRDRRLAQIVKENPGAEVNTSPRSKK